MPSKPELLTAPAVCLPSHRRVPDEGQRVGESRASICLCAGRLSRPSCRPLKDSHGWSALPDALMGLCSYRWEQDQCSVIPTSCQFSLGHGRARTTQPEKHRAQLGAIAETHHMAALALNLILTGRGCGMGSGWARCQRLTCVPHRQPP